MPACWRCGAQYRVRAVGGPQGNLEEANRALPREALHCVETKEWSKHCELGAWVKWVDCTSLMPPRTREHARLSSPLASPPPNLHHHLIPQMSLQHVPLGHIQGILPQTASSDLSESPPAASSTQKCPPSPSKRPTRSCFAHNTNFLLRAEIFRVTLHNLGSAEQPSHGMKPC